MCSYPGEDESRPCPGGFDFDGSVSTQSYCAGGTTTEIDAVIDVVRSLTWAWVERPVMPDSESDLRVEARMTPAGLKLTGMGCDRVVPLGEDAGMKVTP
jgi:hypothetical protein